MIFNIVIYLISGTTKLLSKAENCETHCARIHVHWIYMMKSMGAKTMPEENGETRTSRGGSNKCESREYARANIDVIHTNTRWVDVIRGGADAFSNTFERRDMYELGQVGYREEYSLSNSLL